MANASTAITKVVKEEGKYQAGAADKGNYFKSPSTGEKKLIGTKYGITPGAYFAYYKKEPTQDTIKNLTIDQAVPIYKKNYWDKIKGDEIANTSVADLMMFIVVNSGAGMVKSMKHIANETAGKKIFAETSTPFTSEEIRQLNTLPQDIYFSNLKTFRERFYKGMVANDPSQGIYLKGWLNRLNKHVYSGAKSSTVKQSTKLIIVGLLLFTGGAVAGYKL
jgi:hypothetical protein